MAESKGKKAEKLEDYVFISKPSLAALQKVVNKKADEGYVLSASGVRSYVAENPNYDSNDPRSVRSSVRFLVSMELRASYREGE